MLQTPQRPLSETAWRYGSEEAAQAEFMQRVLANFGGTLLIAAAGAFLGWSLPPAYYMGLMLLQLILILAVVFTRTARGTSPVLVYGFAAVSGATTVPLIKWAIAMAGTSVIYNALAVTGTIFLGMAWLGLTTRKDLTGWSTFLWMGLIGACIASVVGLFLPFSSPIQILLSAAIVIVFAGFTAYDINQMRANWQEWDVTGATLNLYLDFLNMFVNVLRILALLSGGGGDRRD